MNGISNQHGPLLRPTWKWWQVSDIPDITVIWVRQLQELQQPRIPILILLGNATQITFHEPFSLCSKLRLCRKDPVVHAQVSHGATSKCPPWTHPEVLVLSCQDGKVGIVLHE